MSPQYPILDNRPIDHWKVTELKVELKRRKLAIKGLKNDLVKRLAKAIRNERENGEDPHIKSKTEKTVDNGVDCVPHPVVGEKDAKETIDSLAKTNKNIVDCGSITKNNEPENDVVKVDINDSLATLDQEGVKEGDKLVGTKSAQPEVTMVSITNRENVVSVNESVASDEVTLCGQDLCGTETQKENGDSEPLHENENSKPHSKDENTKPSSEDEVQKPKPEYEIFMPNTCTVSNQVSEVSPTLGSPVKYNSISTDYVSMNEKIELKGNIIVDNVKLELDLVKAEMMEPSSSNVGLVSGESHPMDVEEPYDKKSVEAKDDVNDENADTNKKNDIAYVRYPEKLNLDRSSGDDSMEEDVLETKQTDTKYSSDDTVDRKEKTEMPLANEETHVDVVGGDSNSNKELYVESKNHTIVSLQNKTNTIAMPAEKRKLNDQVVVGSGGEPLKRQCRWNTESVKVPDTQSHYPTPKGVSQSTAFKCSLSMSDSKKSQDAPTFTPKDAFQYAAFKRSLSMSDSKNSEDAPKERVVPPSKKPPTNSLRIDRFLRPFTLKAVQELLGKTGTVSNFWMDQIKTHCYVTYSSVEEAIETRNVVYNLQWPPNGGRLLVAEFVHPQEVKMRVDAPQAPVAPVIPSPTVSSAPTTAQPQAQPLHRQPIPRQQPLPPPSPLCSPNFPPTRERLPPPPPFDPPIVTIDDIFQKTKVTPQIYYLPLSEEQVAAKLTAQSEKKA